MITEFEVKEFHTKVKMLGYMLSDILKDLSKYFNDIQKEFERLNNYE